MLSAPREWLRVAFPEQPPALDAQTLLVAARRRQGSHRSPGTPATGSPSATRRAWGRPACASSGARVRARMHQVLEHQDGPPVPPAALTARYFRTQARPGPVRTSGHRPRTCARRCAGRFHFPKGNVRTRHQPTILGSLAGDRARQRPWERLRTFPYGDSVKRAQAAAASSRVSGYSQRSPRLKVIVSKGRMPTGSSSFAVAMSTHPWSRSSKASKVRSAKCTSHK